MERNPNAKCETCPYWNQEVARCQHGPWRPRKTETDWCGQHPDFQFFFPVANASNFKEPG